MLCSFLKDDNFCRVYGARPKACREYPYTNSKKIHQLFDLTIKNSFTCPAVYEIVDKLKLFKF